MKIGRAETHAAVSAHLESPGKAGALRAFAQLAQAEPFYRASLVADLQRRIDGGEYHVSSPEIVEKILGRTAVGID
ncbi:MAG: flagellar biosynthesis anti-sigma factor FlgM [Candidatus Eremiobacteraeota bacterium]|nr:flagellar biosynthesis anti-sigma factor FlgM [Candidatus Eremiobacteraeota bacterium]